MKLIAEKENGLKNKSTTERQNYKFQTPIFNLLVVFKLKIFFSGGPRSRKT